MKIVIVSDEIKSKIMQLYHTSISIRKIAAELGISPYAVHKHISSSTVRMTKRAPKSAEAKKKAGKDAKPVVKATTPHTFTPFTPPPGSPICNATSMGEPYRCPELSYRQPSRA